LEQTTDSAFLILKPIDLPRQSRGPNIEGKEALKNTSELLASYPVGHLLPIKGVLLPAQNDIVEPFIYKNEYFAKTGSGQT
jgi:hypothetical protein